MFTKLKIKRIIANQNLESEELSPKLINGVFDAIKDCPTDHYLLVEQLLYTDKLSQSQSFQLIKPFCSSSDHLNFSRLKAIAETGNGWNSYILSDYAVEAPSHLNMILNCIPKDRLLRCAVNMVDGFSESNLAEKEKYAARVIKYSYHVLSKDTNNGFKEIAERFKPQFLRGVAKYLSNSSLETKLLSEVHKIEEETKRYMNLRKKNVQKRIRKDIRKGISVPGCLSPNTSKDKLKRIKKDQQNKAQQQKTPHR